MRMREALGICGIIACVLIAVNAAHTSDTQTGNWTISRTDEPGEVNFALIISRPGNHSEHESDWPLSAFQGLDVSKSGRQQVHFTITRDAGKFDCEGDLENGEGAGLFHFSADPNYRREMESLGYTDIRAETQFSMAAMDVSLDFARQIKAENLEGLDTDKLIAFKIHGVTPEFVQGLRSAGLDERDADKLIAFRIHGVSPEFVSGLRAAGLNETDGDKLIAFRIHGVSPEMVSELRKSGYSPDADSLIAMRIHGASPEWVAQLRSVGYDHVELDQLVAFRIHGVSPEFIQKLQGLGYHPDPDQLIAMRIHGVTPEWISELKSRGMQNLTIDQLVSMRIHGID
jgi:hypothetical protein